MDAIKEVTIGKRKLSVVYDECPESPREWDNLGRMLCWHNRYSLGDKHDYKTPQDFYDSDEYKDIVVKFPLRLYDHSGLSMSTTKDYPFNDQWDSMQIGYIFVTKEHMAKEYGKDWEANGKLDNATQVLLGQVETYDKYLRGQVFGYILEKVVACDSCHHIDYDVEHSCFGYYAISDIANDVPDEFKEMVESI